MARNEALRTNLKARYVTVEDEDIDLVIFTLPKPRSWPSIPYSLSIRGRFTVQRRDGLLWRGPDKLDLGPSIWGDLNGSMVQIFLEEKIGNDTNAVDRIWRDDGHAVIIDDFMSIHIRDQVPHHATEPAIVMRSCTMMNISHARISRRPGLYNNGALMVFRKNRSWHGDVLYVHYYYADGQLIGVRPSSSTTNHLSL